LIGCTGGEAFLTVVSGGGGGGTPLFGRDGGGGGSFDNFIDSFDFGAGGRGRGGGGITGTCDFFLSDPVLVLLILSIVSSDSPRGLLDGRMSGGSGVSASSLLGDLLDGKFKTKIASPSSTESNESDGVDDGDIHKFVAEVDPNPPWRKDGVCDKNFSGIKESARFSLYGFPKLTISFDRTRACSESSNSPVLGS
jgi:hypothetical protein